MTNSELVTKLGVRINPELLQLALTHSSFAYENGGEDNERLEFLGDSILGYVVAQEVFNRFPDATEGDLTRVKNAVVSAPALATAANRIGLGGHLRLGKGETSSGGAGKVNILADAFEALIGAAFLSGGMPEAALLVEKHIFPLISSPESIRESSDPKTALIERVQRDGLEPISYVIDAEGPEHERTYTATCFSGEQRLGQGSAGTKRGAETEAARAALAFLAES